MAAVGGECCGGYWSCGYRVGPQRETGRGRLQVPRGNSGTCESGPLYRWAESPGKYCRAHLLGATGARCPFCARSQCRRSVARPVRFSDPPRTVAPVNQCFQNPESMMRNFGRLASCSARRPPTVRAGPPMMKASSVVFGTSVRGSVRPPFRVRGKCRRGRSKCHGSRGAPP